jgi:hypothetical protein
MKQKQSSLEKGINVLDTDEDVQELMIEQYECGKKAIIVALAGQKAKIREWIENNDWVKGKKLFLKEFEELKL